ncbi:MAG: adenosylcobinamide-GDP ribazoletransferase [Anaerovoracaceae bacterium]|jgi:adenosylcobinamide-GDP ribazoletransferase
MKVLRGFMMAWGMFSALPCPAEKWDESCRRQMLLALPPLGLLLGVIWSVCAALLLQLPLHPMLSAAVLALLPLWLTGAIHVDGYMDVCDAVFSRRDLDDRRRILKDAAVGAFAAVGLGVLLLLGSAALVPLTDARALSLLPSLACVPLMSRSAAVGAVLTAAPLPASQYHRSSWRADHRGVAAVTAMACLPLLLLPLLRQFLPARAAHLLFAADTASAVGTLTAVRMLLPLLATWIAAQLAGLAARRSLQGMNGDISGFMVTVGELAGALTAGILVSLL